MVEVMDAKGATEALKVGVTATAAPTGMAQLTAVLREEVTSLPGGACEIRVLTATLKPGDCTPRHSHRFPVTLYMHQGTFTLDLEDRAAPVRIAAGQAFVEPAGVPMTGRNEGDEIAHMSLFYVCEPGAPFADPL